MCFSCPFSAALCAVLRQRHLNLYPRWTLELATHQEGIIFCINAPPCSSIIQLGELYDLLTTTDSERGTAEKGFLADSSELWQEPDIDQGHAI